MVRAIVSLMCSLGGAAGLALVGRSTAVARAAPARRAAAPFAQMGAGSPCVIKVVGVGGGGGNAVNRMIQFGQAQTGAVEYWALNTDIQALDASLSPNRLGLGAGTSRGLGAGGKPDMGAASAKESYDQISQMVSGSDMVFVVAGMGGGTGSGAAPIVAEAAKAAGALTVAVVTKPFAFEGQRRMRQAEEAIAKLRQHVDAMIVVSNDRLLDLVEEGTPLQEAFCVADDILRQGVRAPSSPPSTALTPALPRPPPRGQRLRHETELCAPRQPLPEPERASPRRELSVPLRRPRPSRATALATAALAKAALATAALATAAL